MVTVSCPLTMSSSLASFITISLTLFRWMLSLHESTISCTSTADSFSVTPAATTTKHKAKAHYRHATILLFDMLCKSQFYDRRVTNTPLYQSAIYCENIDRNFVCNILANTLQPQSWKTIPRINLYKERQ